MKYPKYPAYISDKNAWGDEYPAHWQLNRLRFACIVNPTKSEIADLPASTEVSFIPMEAVGEYGGIQLETTKMLEEVSQGYTYFRDGDVVVAKITPCFENGKGALAENLVAGVAFGTTELHVLRPRSESVDPKFLFYVTISTPFRKIGEGEMYGAGGQKRVPNSFIENFKQPFPPLKEQHILAAFLDQETAQIDTLIAKQERLIATLQEKRLALIAHAVTKGLNPDTPMKESGVEWLGEVPSHWKILKLKRIASLKSGSGINSDKIEPEGDYPVFGGNGIRGYTEQYSHEGYYALIGRQGALCGNINYAKGRFWASEHAVVVSPTTNLVTKWLGELLRAMNLNQYSISAAQPGLSVEMVSNLFVPYPSFIEQQSIVTFLTQETSKIDTLIEKAKAVIERLQERRSALISAAVTGKIDVRAAMN